MLDIKTMSILIVDDVKSMRSIVRKMLKNLDIGNVLHMAENGLEGLRILHSTRIDFAIIDWKMPIMSGRQLLEAIRNDRSLRDLPVVMVTAESEKEIVLEAAEIEVDGYLIKPLTPAVLEEKIRSIVHQINHPDEATLHLLKAREFEEKDNIPAAIEHMKHAALQKPSASRILRNLGLLYQKTGDEDTMERCLEKAALVNPQDAITRYLLGELKWKKKDLISAARYFLEVMSLTRKFSDRALELGEALLEKKLVFQAKSLFSKLISTSFKELSIIEKIIELCIKHDELEYSKELLNAFLKEHPSNYDLVYKAGVVCETMGDEDTALEHFLTIERKQGCRTDLAIKIAKIYYHKDKVLQADNYLNWVLQRNPKNKEALALRSLL